MSEKTRDQLVEKRLLEQGFVAQHASHVSDLDSLCPIPEPWADLKGGKKPRRLATHVLPGTLRKNAAISGR